MKKRLLSVFLILIMVLMSACSGSEVITVKDDIRDGDETEYVKMDTFKLGDGDDGSDIDIGYCAILIPSGFSESDTVPGMYISEHYPMESSNIYYTVSDPDEDGFVTDELTADSYEKSIENAHRTLGNVIDLKVDAFESTDIEGVPCYKIRTHYNDGDIDVQQLVYIIMASETHVITYSQSSDDELLYDFLNDEGEIKLVREVSQAE